MGWTVLVRTGTDEIGQEQAEVTEKFTFREEAEAWAEQQRAQDPQADVLVTEELP